MINQQFGKVKKIHLIGIGGIGMSGIAKVLLALNYQVSGSDLKNSEITDQLKKNGAVILVGHSRDNIRESQVVVTSSAISKANPEYLEAVDRGIPVIMRGEMLAELMRLKYGIAIAGTHGKTTTTALVAAVCSDLSPTTVIGGKWRGIDSNASLAESRYLICEADESDGSFLKLAPVMSVITNIDLDHMDFYKTEENLRLYFLEFINKTPFYGKAIICLDNNELRDMLAEVRKPYLTYGFSKGADIFAENVRPDRGGMSFDVSSAGNFLGTFHLNIPGKHNVLNSLAAIAVGLELEIDVESIRESLCDFLGVNRRMQSKGEWGNFKVIDDYGHHPTEIKATLSALKEQFEHLVVIFQPHRYSRTLNLYADFANSFFDADEVYLMDIYSAGEEPLEGVSSSLIYDKMRDNKNVTVGLEREEIATLIKHNNKNRSGAILTIGAGDVHKMADYFV